MQSGFLKAVVKSLKIIPLMGKSITSRMHFLMSFSFMVCVFFCDVPRGTFCYLPNKTSNTFISLGDMPGMRLACPMVFGLILFNFCLASVEID